MSEVIRRVIAGKSVPVLGSDVDTDRIVPARFLKEITFSNMGDYLFYDQRFDKFGALLDHPLNDPQYMGARIMIVGRNFGCGSSREHAPQAIMRFGIQAIIGESFAEIFAGNCKAIGVPVVTMAPEDLAELTAAVQACPEAFLSLDLDSKELRYDDRVVAVDLPEARRQSFLKGTWDSRSVLRQNHELVAKVATSLPYIRNFES